MEDKYNTLTLEQYSRNLAKLLCDRYFAATETINGQQLISFSPVKQINLFVIKELLIRWNREMANLKSPYFDFEDHDVKDALKQFMNVLSRRILIRRPDFEPLLQQAITDTFILVSQPEKTFDEKFVQLQDEVTVPKLQEHLKYLDLNKAPFQDFIQGLQPHQLEKSNLTRNFRLYTQSHYRDMATLDQLLEQLNPLLPITKQDLQKTAAAPKDEPLRVAPEPASGPMFNVPGTAPQDSLIATKVASSGPSGQASFQEQKSPEPQQPAVPPVSPPSQVAQPVSTATQTTGPEVKLYEKFKTEKPNLNEAFKKPDTPTLATKDQRNVETLKEAISINQRFAFINELFNGENMVYHEAIQKLDAFPDAESAKHYLFNDLAEKHNWVKKEEHLNKLARLIDRKFSE